MKDECLKQIANTLIMYAYHIKNNGLFNGKAGITLFLYKYSEYIKCNFYKDYADNLLDGLLKSSKNMPFDFENGILGFGWFVDFLLKNGYVDGDKDQVLAPIDKAIMSNMAYQSPNGLFGQGLYIIERFRDDFSERIINKDTFLHIMISIENEIKLRNINDIPLHRICSFLYFVKEMNSFMNTVADDNLIKILSNIKERRINTNDSFVEYIFFSHLTNEVMYKEITSDFVFKQYNDIQNFILQTWYNIIFNKRINKINCSLTEIKSFINNELYNVQVNHFTVNKGLAGLGLALLTNY